MTTEKKKIPRKKERKPERIDPDSLPYEVGKYKPPMKSRFPKGKSGNPGGFSQAALEGRALLSRDVVAEIMSHMATGSLEDLKKIAKDPKSPALKMMIASLAAKVIQKGDSEAFKTILDRIIGPVKQEMKYSGTPLNGPQVVVHLPSNGREAPAIEVSTALNPPAILPEGEGDGDGEN